MFHIVIIIFFISLYAFDIYAFVFDPKIKDICMYILSTFYFLIFIVSALFLFYNSKYKIQENLEISILPWFLTLIGQLLEIILIIVYINGLNTATTFALITFCLSIIPILITVYIDFTNSEDNYQLK